MMIKGDIISIGGVFCRVCLGFLLYSFAFINGAPLSTPDNTNVTEHRDIIMTSMDIVHPTAHSLTQEKVSYILISLVWNFTFSIEI